MTRSQPQIPTDRVETVIGRIHTVWIRSGGLGRREEGQEGARRREVVDLIGITSNGINKNISPSPHGGMCQQCGVAMVAKHFDGEFPEARPFDRRGT